MINLYLKFGKKIFKIYQVITITYNVFGLEVYVSNL